jgi:hypothetical protein
LFRGFCFAVIVFAVIVFAIITGYAQNTALKLLILHQKS